VHPEHVVGNPGALQGVPNERIEDTGVQRESANLTEAEEHDRLADAGDAARESEERGVGEPQNLQGQGLVDPDRLGQVLRGERESSAMEISRRATAGSGWSSCTCASRS